MSAVLLRGRVLAPRNVSSERMPQVTVVQTRNALEPALQAGAELTRDWLPGGTRSVQRAAVLLALLAPPSAVASMAQVAQPGESGELYSMLEMVRSAPGSPEHGRHGGNKSIRLVSSKRASCSEHGCSCPCIC